MADRTPRPPKGPEPRRVDPASGATPRRHSESDPGLERSATDSGRMGDKIGNPDPAAAPVQGDAEASGHPTSREAVERMVEERQRTAGRAGTTGTTGTTAQQGFVRNEQPHVREGRAPQGGRSTTSSGLQTGVIALVVLVAIGLLAAIMFT